MGAIQASFLWAEQMDAESQLYNRLSADDRLIGVVEDRVYPILLPQGTPYPAVTFQLISRDPGGSLSGDTTHLDRARVQVDMWAQDYGDSKAVYEAVRAAMQGGIVARFIDARDIYDEQTKQFRISADFYIWEPRS